MKQFDQQDLSLTAAQPLFNTIESFKHIQGPEFTSRQYFFSSQEYLSTSWDAVKASDWKHNLSTRLEQLTYVLGLTLIVILAGSTMANAQLPAANPTGQSNGNSLIMSFNGQINQHIAQLNWITENETAVRTFVIERAGDQADFDSIGEVAGDNNNNHTAFGFTDTHVLNGNNYYRIRQIMYDGSFKYSKILSLADNQPQVNLQVFPNPAIAQLNYVVNCPTAEQVFVQVYNLSGVLLATVQQQMNAGSNKKAISVGALTQGSYLLRITDGRGTLNYVQTFAKI